MTNTKLLNDNPELLTELQAVLTNYLSQKKNMSLNGLSKKCSISEPTLRRILKGQVKTLPTVTTILDMLTVISGDTNTDRIAKKYPGPISDFLNSVVPQIVNLDADYSSDLNLELQNSQKYLIYKLASNAMGVTHKKISDLFGVHGIKSLEDLIHKDFVSKSKDRYYSKSKSFIGSHNQFIANFKAIADFIKTRSSISKIKLNPLLANYSESVSVEAYKEITTIQKRALQKIRTIMMDEKSRGPIPFFVLSAVDTLDSKTAYELDDDLKSKLN